MSLKENKDEKAKLEEDRANAKVRARQTWNTICQIKAILKTYQTDHQKWTKHYEEADRKLAEIDGRLKKVKMGAKGADKDDDGLHLLVKMDRSQIKRIAATIGISIPIEEDEDN